MGISGKCDFQDTCEMFHSVDEILNKYRMFISGNEIVPLKMESKKDLVAYYPYLTSMMFSNKDGGSIVLSRRSFIDLEEDEMMQNKLDTLIKYFKRCKRKKEKFDKNKALHLITLFPEEPQPYQMELINRVVEFGTNATTDELHDPMHDRMRDEWYKLMINSGWDENVSYRWVYGWHRYFKRDNKKEENV